MDDLISRQAAIDALNDLMLSTNVRKLDFEQIGYNHALADGILTIRRVPSAQRKGRWIYRGESESFPGNNEYECSVCGFADAHSESQDVPFCWHCGARMEKGESGEESL